MGSTMGVNIAVELRAMSRRIPHKRAIVEMTGIDGSGRPLYRHLTFAQLEAESDRVARGFLRAGIGPGMRTILFVTPGIDFAVTTFALFKVGAVIVMIDPGIGPRSLGICINEVEPAAFIGVPKAQIARILFGWGRRSIRTTVTVGYRLFWGGYNLDDLRDEGCEPFPIQMTDPGAMAAILFTSGSTGVAKGAVYSHRIFCAQVEYLRKIWHFGQDDVDLATFPLFALFDPVLGVTAVIPLMDASRPVSADPAVLLRAVDDCGCTQMFANPILIDKIGRFGESRGIRLSMLRRVISAGAPVRSDSLQRFQKLLPDDAQTFTPYGATEALPVSSIGSREILHETAVATAKGEGVCVGTPNPHVAVRIIRITDEPIPVWSDDLVLPEGEIGEVVVRGDVVTREYWRRPDRTRAAKIVQGDEVWHRMGDLGRFDPMGRLWFFGRKDHRVVTSQGTLYTVACEAIFNAHPAVFRSALVGIGPRGAERPVIVVELLPEKRRHDRRRLRDELRARGAAWSHTTYIDDFLVHRGFPVDVRHNAKIDRHRLAAWAALQVRRRMG